MKKITLLCGICVCCLSGFAQSSKESANNQTLNENQTQARITTVSKPHILFGSGYLVGATTTYRGQDYTFTVDGAEAGATFTDWLSSDNSIASLTFPPTTNEGTFTIEPRTGAAVSYTIYVTVTPPGAPSYSLSFASQSVTCHNCDLPK
jgi:hypothetical protein